MQNSTVYSELYIQGAVEKLVEEYNLKAYALMQNARETIERMIAKEELVAPLRDEELIAVAERLKLDNTTHYSTVINPFVGRQASLKLLEKVCKEHDYVYAGAIQNHTYDVDTIYNNIYQGLQQLTHTYTAKPNGKMLESLTILKTANEFEEEPSVELRESTSFYF